MATNINPRFVIDTSAPGRKKRARRPSVLAPSLKGVAVLAVILAVAWYCLKRLNMESLRLPSDSGKTEKRGSVSVTASDPAD